MFRVTTPTHVFTLPIDTSSCKEILITYKQDDIKLIKHYENGTLPDGMTLNDKDAIIRLTQEETKQFVANTYVKTQVRVLTTGNDSYASQIFNVIVNEVLNDEVLSDDN